MAGRGGGLRRCIGSDLLLEENIAGAGAFVALTSIDEENILLSLFAKRVGHGKVITKINRIDFASVIAHWIRTQPYTPSISPPTGSNAMPVPPPTRWAAIWKRCITSSPGKVEAAEFVVSDRSAVTEVPLSELKCKKGILVAAIMRNGSVIIPRGKDTVQVGDAVIIVSGDLSLHSLTDILE